MPQQSWFGCKTHCAGTNIIETVFMVKVLNVYKNYKRDHNLCCNVLIFLII